MVDVNIIDWCISPTKLLRREDSILITGNAEIASDNGHIASVKLDKVEVPLKNVPNYRNRFFTEVNGEYEACRIHCAKGTGITVQEKYSAKRLEEICKIKYDSGGNKLFADLPFEDRSTKIDFWPLGDRPYWTVMKYILYTTSVCPECGGVKLEELPCRECGFHKTVVVWIAYFRTAPADSGIPNRRWLHVQLPIGVTRAEMLTIPDRVTYDTARNRARKFALKEDRVIIGGGTHKGLYVLKPSDISDYRKVLENPEDS